MPRPSHAQGRPGTQVIPDDWETTHRPVADKTHRGDVALRHPGTERTWQDHQTVTAQHEPYWTGAARIVMLGAAARTVVLAGDREVLVQYLVTIAADATGIEQGDLVRVTTSGDPQLDGRDLIVQHAGQGTERFERPLFCTLAT